MSGFESRRPPIGQRNFASEAVERAIERVSADMADAELAWMFANCLPNTLDTTVEFGRRLGKPDTFVITGDIHAMWLRDSTAQVWPYVRFAGEDEHLAGMLEGVIRRQAFCVTIDPYANAFNRTPQPGPWHGDQTEMNALIHERKWEIDSLCSVIRLSHGFHAATGRGDWMDQAWLSAMRLIVKTFRQQQRIDRRGPYRFQRVGADPKDTLYCDGWGVPARPCGLIFSGFRPSDDACFFPLLIPSNLYAVTSLRQLAELATTAGDQALASDAAELAGEVAAAVVEHGVVERDGKRLYAYEVDGYATALLADDANLPNLLSLPYLGCVDVDDEVYRNTRAFVLSEDNPFFYRGPAAEGVGGIHVGPGMVWPMSIVTRALTSSDDDEIRQCLRWLKTTHAGTGLMHEAFRCDDPAMFTRPWFAWANTLFGELILNLHQHRPGVLAEAL